MFTVTAKVYHTEVILFRVWTHSPVQWSELVRYLVSLVMLKGVRLLPFLVECCIIPSKIRTDSKRYPIAPTLAIDARREALK